MAHFVVGVDRAQATLLPECLDDWVDENNPVRAVDVFVDALDLCGLGFSGVHAQATGRPSYHPSVLLKLYIYGYLNRVHSSRRLEREAGRNLEVMWLTGRLTPDHKTIADFRRDNGPAIKKVCAQFVELCREMGLLANASVAIDGSKFKAVNSRDNNFTKGKLERRLKQIEDSVARYLGQLDTADRRTVAGEDPSETVLLIKARLKEKLVKLEEEVLSASVEQELKLTPDLSAVVGAGAAQQLRAGISSSDYTYLLGTRYSLSSTTALRASVARKIRFPTLRDLYSVDGGNPGLKTEVTQNYEAAVEHQIPALQVALSVGLYRVEAENFIERQDGVFSNVSLLQLEGVEATAKYSGIPGLELSTGYTFLHSENLTPGAPVRDLQYRPEHKLTLSASYKFEGGLSVHADYLWVAGSKAISGGGGGGEGATAAARVSLRKSRTSTPIRSSI